MHFRNVNAIVTDDEKTAVECIQYLREQRLGRATFLPLDTIRAKPVDESLRLLDDSVKLVFDLVEYVMLCEFKSLLANGGKATIRACVRSRSMCAATHSCAKLCRMRSTLRSANAAGRW